MAVKEQERTPATGEEEDVVLRGDAYEGMNSATDLLRFMEQYRAHPNLRLRANGGFTPYAIFFPLLFISLSPCCFKFVFLCGSRAFVISFSRGLAVLSEYGGDRIFSFIAQQVSKLPCFKKGNI